MVRDRGEEFDKHLTEDVIYFEYMQHFDELHDGPKDIVTHFPAYVGYVNLARYLMFYDIYKRVAEINGHIADIGTFKGASFLFLAKLVKLFEPYNTTVVHGFDWFKGMDTGTGDNPEFTGKYVGDFGRLNRLIDLQGLSPIAKIHSLDLTNDLPKFFTEREYMKFKLVFLDCGIHEVLEKSIEYFWPRLVNGGILVLDHYNSKVSPSESILLDRVLDGRTVHTTPFSRQPTGFVVK